MSARVLRVVRHGTRSVRFDPRTVAVGLGALAVTLVAGLLTMAVGGAYPLGIGEVLAVLVGRGDGAAEFVVLDLRLSRVLLGAGVGLGLGLGGALLQSLARNPLGSPDLLGFTQGAATGALIAILVTSASTAVVAGSALVGGLLTAVVTVVCAGAGGRGRGLGDLGGLRLVLVGVGIGAVLLAVNNYLVSQAQLRDAQGALSWLLGDLGGRSWPQVVALWVLLVPLGGAALALTRRASLLELGDRMAGGLGVPVDGARVALLLLSVGLAASATAAAGPVAFVALAAPQIARLSCRSATPVPLPSALVGAAVVVLGDLAAQRLFPTPLPVSVVTGVLGGLYLFGLLLRRQPHRAPSLRSPRRGART